MNKFGILILTSLFIVILTPVSDAGTQDKWIPCDTSTHDTKDGNYYCCKDATGLGWKNNVCEPIVTVTRDKTPVAGETVVFTAIASDDETDIKEVKILIDEYQTVSGFETQCSSTSTSNPSDCSCTLTTCTFSRTYNQAGQEIKYYAFARDDAKSVTYRFSDGSTKNLESACASYCLDFDPEDLSQPFSFVVGGPKLVSCTASPTSVNVGGKSTITTESKKNDNPVGNLEIIFASSRTSDTFSPSTAKCTTANDGKCSVEISSNTYGLSTITCSAIGYTHGQVQVTFKDFTIDASPNSLTIEIPSSGLNSGTSTIKVTSLSEFSSSVSLLHSWQGTAPTGVTVSYPSSVTPPTNGEVTGTLTVNVPSTASTGTYTLRVTGTSGTLTHFKDITVTTTQPTGTLTGTVTDAFTNSPIIGAIVTLSTQTQPIFKQATTDNLGKYTVTLGAGTYSAIASATGYNPSTSVDVAIISGQTTTKNFALTPVPAIVIQPCTYSLSMKNLPKTNTYQCTSLPCFSEWAITLQDKSSSSCSSPIAYTVSDVTIDPKCDPNTDIYDYGKAHTNKWNRLSSVSVTRNGESNAFTVFARAKGFDSCSVTLNFKDPTGKIADPSFTVIPAGISNQAPHVGFFDFSGDTSTFTTKWEVLYPDNNPKREMKVKCGLNCDPDLQDCSAIAGKGCLPYDASQGTEEIKKNSCGVSSPAYDFTTTNKIICLFYDPADTNLKTRSNHDFTPVDFDARTTGKIVTTVGKAAELKIDVTNKGLVPDSYKITIAPPSTADVSPATITTDKIGSGELVSSFASVTPLVDADGEVEVTVQSLTSSQTKSLKVQLQPGLYALPEFGLVGFLQIIVIAAIVYFLLIQRKVNLKRRRRR